MPNAFRDLAGVCRLAAARLVLLGALVALAGPLLANPFVQTGDPVLRHDIQRLADYGIITGPVTTWPLMWGPLAADIGAYPADEDLPPDVRQSLNRVRDRAAWEMRSNDLLYRASASVSESPARIRSFQNTPRESAELSAGLSYTGDLFAVSLNGKWVDSPDDGKEHRYDDSVIGVALGNYTISANTLDRWWGPGWDGSLILSNNARPFPSVSIDRNFTEPFSSKWLSWLGPWDLAVTFGQLESDRHIPDARFFGLRFNFRPLPSLEIGLSRTAQWCGDNRPCDADTFFDLLIGRDNRGQGGIDGSNEPGNQLAGFDARWHLPGVPLPMTLYGQFIGEDEAGGFPSRYLGQVGAETSGIWRQRWSYRMFAEFAATNCQFYQSDEHFNCAYNHGVYQTGYRYRGRVIGHGAESDSRLLTAGLILANAEDHQWIAELRAGELNRFGAPDNRNTLTATRQDVISIDAKHARPFQFGTLSFGLGYESIDDVASGTTSDDVRAFFQWRTGY